MNRWVASATGDIPRTRDGLVDAEIVSRDWYSGDKPQLAADLAETPRSFVLLAPGGAGKTTLIEYLKSREPASVSLDLQLHDRRSLADALDSLASRSISLQDDSVLTVFVDTVDQAIRDNPNIGYALAAMLGRPDLGRIAWRFACRPGSWTLDLSEKLAATLDSFDELELLPLSLTEIREMAGPEADLFLAAVEHERLTRLLAYPLHAVNLLTQWRETGHMPASRSEAMRHAVTRMLTESSTSRPPGTLDDHRRDLIAERLAALSVFCGATNFALGAVVVPGSRGPARRAADDGIASTLAAASVPTQAEPDLAGTMLTVTDIRDVLGTALFTAAGHGTVTFVHQAYPEFLAAQYLARRRVQGQRLTSLLGADVNGRVPGPLIEVLGWLLASGSRVPVELISDNAKQLLDTAGLELADEQVRRHVVEALLYGAANGTISEGWRADTSVLSHPGLGVQLRDAARGATDPWVIFWICRIARQNAVAEIVDDTLGLARDSSWPDFIRAEAVKAFGDLAPRDRLEELAPMLDLGPEQDPMDDIHAAALRAVMPDAVEFDLIRNALRPSPTPTVIGSDYYRLLGELPALLPSEHVLAVLADALRRRSDRSDYAFDRFISDLLRRVWGMRDYAAAVAMGEALGRAGLHSLRTSNRDTVPWVTEDDPDLRRAMAAAVLAGGEYAALTILHLNMLGPTDLGWLIDWMTVAGPETHDVVAAVLRQLAWNVADAESAEHVLAVDEAHPAHQALKHFQGEVRISDRPEGLPSPLGADPTPTPSEIRRLRDAVAGAVRNIHDWWLSVIALAGDTVDGEIHVGWDLTERPLWPTMTVDEQDRFLRLGTDYVNNGQPDPSCWQGRNPQRLHDVMPDWSAVFLLATLTTHRPEILAAVDNAAWDVWAATVTAVPNYTNQGDWQRRLRDAAPHTGRDAIDQAFREQVLRDITTSLTHHPLADLTDHRFIDVVEQIARSTDQSGPRRAAAIDVLIDHAPDIALRVARTVMNDTVVPAAAFTAVGKIAPDELVERWTAQGQLGPVEHVCTINPERLSDSLLVQLTRMLLDEMSFASDPPQRDDFVGRTPQGSTRQLRVHLLQAMAGRGMTTALEVLAHGRPAADLEHIQHMMQEARDREALANWRPVLPEAFMELMARGDARLVRDSAGLLTVLLEQLEQIQHDIRERAQFRSLWDHEPGTPRASPKVEDTISDWLADQLRIRLASHVVVDREIQVTRTSEHGIGTRIDLTATSHGAVEGRVILEAKRINHQHLMTALDRQLVGQYMEPAELTHGIYIVYWTTPKLRPRSWPRSHPDANTLAEQLRAQAQRHLPDKHIAVVVLDIGPPG